MYRAIVLTLIVLAAGPAALALNQQFDWLPSGTIDVGDRTSEGAAGYEAVGPVETVRLGYLDESPHAVTGRRITGPETFIIRPASWRLGPAWAHLVICKTIDTHNPPPTLHVAVLGGGSGTWRPAPQQAGPRRLRDLLYVIPRTMFPGDKPPAELRVTLTSDEPHLSLGYRFYATRDWDIVESPVGDLTAATTKTKPADEAYINGLLFAGNHEWDAALEQFDQAEAFANGSNRPQLAHLARIASRRARAWQLHARLKQQSLGEDERFARHYHLGLLAGAWGCWEVARAEFAAALEAHPTHADATYRLAEAMEYCRQPIAEWAPLMERAGMLGEGEGCNVEDVLFAVHVPEWEGTCNRLSKADLDALRRDWRYVEQLVYGASLGAWKLRTHYVFCDEQCPEWVMQAGWIFLPPDSFADYEGQYQYSIGTAGFGWSHAGGSDCGVAGAGGANIGAQRNWEVFLHEWNHEFDWVFLFAESGPGYPVTHDSDGCGKQPIVSMGCGHRSSMRYYVTPAQYRRHRGTDRVQSAAFVDQWQLGPILAAPDTTATDADALAAWLIENGHFTQQRIEQLQREREAQARQYQEVMDNPNTVPAQPPRQAPPAWPEFLRQRWNQTKMIDRLVADEEAAFVQGQDVADVDPITGRDDFIDLLRHEPGAPEKCAVYARTFIYSPTDQEVRLWIGYNDCGILWLNGRQLTTGRYYAVAKWADQKRPYMLAVPGHLQAGWNCVTLKTERGGGDWGYSLHVVDFENQPIEELRVASSLPAGAECVRYEPPTVGPHYKWADVKGDYLEKLPRLDNAALAEITGIDGIQCDPHRFLLMLPPGVEPVAGSRFIGAADDRDTELNNYLNWDLEAAGALRYAAKDGGTRDLVFVRPEYVAEFLALLDEGLPPDANVGDPTDRILGYLWLDEATYGSTPNRPFTARAALVIDAYALGDYPADDVGLLGFPKEQRTR